MGTFKVEVTHIGRYERRVVVEVEAESLDEAVERVESGDVDAPAFDDPRWTTGYDIQNEQVLPA